MFGGKSDYYHGLLGVLGERIDPKRDMENQEIAASGNAHESHGAGPTR